MSPLRVTLVSDGSSDQALIPLLKWILLDAGVQLPLRFEWADLGRLKFPPKEFPQRISAAHRFFPADVMFVHRDAEKDSYQKRKDEILRAVSSSEDIGHPAAIICIVPVRMQEAWLLFDEEAIRHAVGNPNGRDPLLLPEISQLERLPDPKEILHRLLKEASGLRGRRLKRFRPEGHVRRVADFITDFSPLYALPAFETLTEDVRVMVEDRDWR